MQSKIQLVKLKFTILSVEKDKEKFTYSLLSTLDSQAFLIILNKNPMWLPYL